MGWVWNILLSHSNEELWEDGEDEPRSECEPMEQINKWLLDGRLVSLTEPTYADDAGNGLDANLFGGGYKRFDIERFIKVVERQKWKDRAGVQLWVKGAEEGMGNEPFTPVNLWGRRHRGPEIAMTMTPAQLARFARRQLSSVQAKSGQLLYSGVKTLRRGPLYLMGHNPGGDPSDGGLMTIRQSIQMLPRQQFNSYLDSSFSGRDTLQRRVIWLLSALGVDPRRVAASNLCFVRSRDAKSSRMREYAEICWPVHQEILRIIQPRLVIVYGNSTGSPYEFLANKFGLVQPAAIRSGHGTWSCRTFVVPGRFRVVGLPHLSRYDITAHPRVVQWIKSLLGQKSVTVRTAPGRKNH